MSRVAVVPILFVLACSGAANQTGTDGYSGHADAPRAVVKAPRISGIERPIRPGPGEIIAVQCPSRPFQESGDRRTQLAFCEHFSWDVSRCERQGSMDMTAEETCQLVAEQDLRRATLEKLCMAQSMPSDLLSQRYAQLEQCSFPPNGDGTYRIPFCHEKLSCFHTFGLTR